jgi:hypothetical protein
MTGLRDGVARPTADVELTVVIAAYDAEATLAEQLDALAAQRVPFAWEVVVADNGSTDGTAALARSYAGRLRLRVVDASATPGAGAARNVGVSVAHAPLVAFCDADDVVGDGWLLAMRTALRDHAFVAGRFEGGRLNSPTALRSRTLPQQHGLQESQHLPGLRAAGAGNMGIRADVFRAVGGFDPHCLYLEDTDLCWRVQLAGVPLTWAPDAVLHVRLRGDLRSAARQGFHYGTGERWLSRRYRDQAQRMQATAALHGGTPAVDDLAAGTLPAGGEARTGATGLAGAALTGAALTGAALTDATIAGGALGGAALTGAALSGVRIADAGRRATPGAVRALRRVTATAGELARVRSLGELGAWCWDVGFGAGYAFGRVEEPEPVQVARISVPEPTRGIASRVPAVPAPMTRTEPVTRPESVA